MRSVRNYFWSAVFAWGLTLSGAALSAAGVISALGWSFESCAFALMMLFAIGSSNAAAEAAIHAMRRARVVWAIFLPALACAIGFACAANIGVHLGWEVASARATHPELLPNDIVVDLGFYFLAFAKPASAWFIEGRKSMDREDAERADAESIIADPTETDHVDDDVADLEEERQKRVASRKGWPPIDQERVAKACRAIRDRGEQISATRVATELNVGRDRILRAAKAGEIKLAA
jgi:hypothetical protein